MSKQETFFRSLDNLGLTTEQRIKINEAATTWVIAEKKDTVKDFAHSSSNIGHHKTKSEA